MKNRGFTLVELLVVIAIIGVLVALLIPVLGRARESARRSTCVSNLKQMALVFKMHEDLHRKYPPMKAYDCEGNASVWDEMIDPKSIYPNILEDWNVLVCPSSAGGANALENWDQGKTTNPKWHSTPGFANNGKVDPCEVFSEPYVYLGWAIEDRMTQTPEALQNLETNIQAWGQEIAANRRKVEKDWTVAVPGSGNAGTNTIFRLRDGVGRFLVTDINDAKSSGVAQSKLPIMWDVLAENTRHFNHAPSGCNVLYMDGHVEFVTWKKERGVFPVNQGGLSFHRASHP